MPPKTININAIKGLTDEFKDNLPVLVNFTYDDKNIKINGVPKTRCCTNIVGKNENNDVYYCATRANFPHKDGKITEVIVVKNKKGDTETVQLHELYCLPCSKILFPTDIIDNKNKVYCKNGCDTTPSYCHRTPENKHESLTGTHCKKCGIELGYKSCKPFCAEPDCWIRATYGKVAYDANNRLIRTDKNRAEGNVSHCQQHGERLGYEDVCNPRCEDCDVRACFGITTKSPTKCNKHKLLIMTNIVNKLCRGKNGEVCHIHPTFNVKGSKGGIYCSRHADDGMVDVVSKLCEYDECPIRASFSEYGDNGKKFCETHIPKTDVNPEGISVAKMIQRREKENKACITCKGQPATHGFFYDKHKSWCSNCAPLGSVNLKAPLCITCHAIRPSFGIDKPKYCKGCNYEGLPDLTHKNCIICKARRAHYVSLEIYNQETLKNNKNIYPIVCSKCFVEGVEYVNVGYPTCAQKNCKLRAYFNIRGEIRPLYCYDHTDHKLMIDVVHNVCLDCPTHASYNYAEEKIPIYCRDHIKDGMVNMKPKCITPYCDNNGYKHYQSRCFVCFSNEFPNDPLISKFKTKERTTVDHIRKNFPNYTWVADKIIDGGCSRKRPDLYLDMGEYAIIIEVDEMQHKGYVELCEQNRVGHLIEDATKAIVLIRFNPDSYQSKTGKVDSCWGYTPKRGMHKVLTKMTDNWDERLLTLANEVQKWIGASDFDWNNNLLTEVKLFYDCK